MTARPFRDRGDAGRQLAGLLDGAAVDVVLALPRGGVPVAAEVAAQLGKPLDVLIVRKLGVPGHEELGMGAVGEHGVRVLNADLIRQLGISDSQIESVTASERAELERRVAAYRGGRPLIDVEGKNVVVVDDGLATGISARAALTALRELAPARVVLAVPVGAPDTLDAMSDVADDVVAVARPSHFAAVGQWYRDFRQVSDREVADAMD